MNLNSFASAINIPHEQLQSIYESISGQYSDFYIPKKSGGKRHILIPSDNLKIIQKNILQYFLETVPIANNACGFRKGLSIVDNARQHVKKECILALDIEDFFPSISLKQVKRCLINNGFDKESSVIISSLCTYRKILPQGSPASPYLSNIVCYELDLSLASIAKSLNASYTRYADDITFSGAKDLIYYLDKIIQIINSYGFRINTSKTHIRFNNELQVVTGIVVNEKLSIPNQLKKLMRQHIYYCKKFGVNEHLKRIKFAGKSYRRHMFGLCSFIKMIDPDLGKQFFIELNSINWDS